MHRMQHAATLALLLALGAVSTACGDDSTGSGGSDGTGGATSASTTTSTASAATGTTTSGGQGGSDEGGAPPVCTRAREDALGAIESVSEGDVEVLEEADGAATIWIDATAGGLADQANNPWIYVDLAARARVDVDDVQADTDTSWDIALKRPIIRSNNHDGGLAGSGESAFVNADFADVTAADIAGASFGEEHWFDSECALLVDQTGAIATSFDGWYLYEDMVVTPAPGTWLVRGGAGDEVFKIAVLDYYANSDGTSGQAGGRYLMRVAQLQP